MALTDMMHEEEARAAEASERRALAGEGVDPSLLAGDAPTEAWKRALVLGAQNRRN